MSTLQVRELPERLYQKLKEQAAEDHRSLSQEAIVMLEKGLNMSLAIKEKRRVLISTLRGRNVEPGKNDELPSPVELIRKDRER